ncbi:MAG: SDR family oxidoreductase [Thermoanaerobaculia bacterium]
MTDRPLSGKVALVTGAAVRVGRAIALALADAGADIALHYRSSVAAAEQTASEIRSRGRRCATLTADLAQPPECRRTIAETIRELGTLDFLVHSAGNFFRASLEDTTETVWDSAMNLNARAGFLLAREAAPVLRERRGRIVLVSDFLARDPARHYLAHSVSKAAVEGLVRALAVELAPEVSVNGVAPGTVLVPGGTSAEQTETLARRVPAKRNGDPQDIAQTVGFLCAGPPNIKRQVIRVDGGKDLI